MASQYRILQGTLVHQGQTVPDGLVVISADAVVWSGPARDVPEQLARNAEPLSWGTSGEVIIAPGLVDQHHHGCFGMDFGSSDAATIRDTLPALYSTGTTSVVASLITADLQHLIERIELLAPLVREGLLAGVHLEGPFLAEGRCGAHDPALLRNPDQVELAPLLTAGEGVLRSITFAPELPGAETLTRTALENGLIPSVGHTQADFKTASAALRSTAEYLGSREVTRWTTGRRPTVTHLFNAMDPLHHRSPGTVAASLQAAARSEAVVELIADGTHMADDTAAAVFTMVGSRNIALTTDSMAAAGLGDGQYRLGALDVVVSGGEARLAQSPHAAAANSEQPPSIAGGTATLLSIVNRVVRTSVPLSEALQAATEVPAYALGLHSYEQNAHRPIGTLTPGAAADLLVLQVSEEGDLELLQVLRRGQSVRNPSM
ncbi:N-acetylglucosamine-6-phosphate deacetylase [Nesterenkonia sphaerica]|uniref:N-acetylglucosamine-6-phosphate deacetylase n=2 Tax=Nesterenkonia sphaerica TaxID=1804988 RepID=A0A5R9A1R8_9MICC|nr:N-acetylglucosamine-6-phosphate deacetylase [Nesterenkonia sphaerica]